MNAFQGAFASPIRLTESPQDRAQRVKNRLLPPGLSTPVTSPGGINIEPRGTAEKAKAKRMARI